MTHIKGDVEMPKTTIRYLLLYKPNDRFPCKRKYLHDAENDREAIELARKYVEKKSATIYSLIKIV